MKKAKKKLNRITTKALKRRMEWCIPLRELEKALGKHVDALSLIKLPRINSGILGYYSQRGYKIQALLRSGLLLPAEVLAKFSYYVVICENEKNVLRRIKRAVENWLKS